MKIYTDVSGFSLDKFKAITNFRNLNHYKKVFSRTGNRIMGVVLQEVRDEIARQGRTGRLSVSYTHLTLPTKRIV